MDSAQIKDLLEWVKEGDPKAGILLAREAFRRQDDDLVNRIFDAATTGAVVLQNRLDKMDEVTSVLQYMDGVCWHQKHLIEEGLDPEEGGLEDEAVLEAIQKAEKAID